jgi:hypothetical protein
MARFTLDQYPSKGRRPGRQHPHVSVICDVADLYAGALRGNGIHTPDDLDRFLENRPVSVVEEGILRDALERRSGCARTYDGHILTPQALATLFGPGTLLSRILMADGRVLDQGTDVRFAQGSLRDAMLVRDMGCRFPRATRPPTLPLRLGPAPPLHVHDRETAGRAPLPPRSARPDDAPPIGRHDPAITLARPDERTTTDIHQRTVDDHEPSTPTAVALRDLVVTRHDADGYPTTAAHGHTEVHLSWDRTPPDQRADEIARIHARIRVLRSTPPHDPLAA